MSANASATSASLDDLADGLRGGGAHRQLRPCGEPRCLTQGAVSRAIATLEQSLGFILFARTGRRVQLTETGRAYAEQISVALDQIRRATSATIEATGSPAPISVATLPSFDAAIHFGDPDWQGRAPARMQGAHKRTDRLRPRANPSAVSIGNRKKSASVDVSPTTNRLSVRA
jgi:DNA-binding transcriptional LysR family regulator